MDVLQWSMDVFIHPQIPIKTKQPSILDSFDKAEHSHNLSVVVQPGGEPGGAWVCSVAFDVGEVLTNSKVFFYKNEEPMRKWVLIFCRQQIIP